MYFVFIICLIAHVLFSLKFIRIQKKQNKTKHENPIVKFFNN